MMALKHYVSLKSHSLAMPFWKIRTFEKVEDRVSKTALVIVSNVDYSLLLREERWEWLPTASLERRLLHHFQNKLQYIRESET